MLLLCITYRFQHNTTATLSRIMMFSAVINKLCKFGLQEHLKSYIHVSFQLYASTIYFKFYFWYRLHIFIFANGNCGCSTSLLLLLVFCVSLSLLWLCAFFVYSYLFITEHYWPGICTTVYYWTVCPLFSVHILCCCTVLQHILEMCKLQLVTTT